ncbi:Subtilase family protein [Fibrobacter sp. UWB16]|uniref:S8 family serine peptidase n=1 Tax=unclassified Fibrobacter TaxID=2634177 RepID=UPI000B52917D|nr:MULTISPECIES: S8 family serine peptidase [unclassified Fibrobacter]OWV22189.1 hypothetical protein B7991_04320 [Fibrobacter sp. UWB3]SOD14562.1 Subtilase family protein [Fibrobacter sp. UWB16]
MFNSKILLLMWIVLAVNAVAAERSVAVSSAELNVIDAKTDVLGRHNSKVRNTPQAYVKTTKSMALAKEGENSPNPNTVSIEPHQGFFEYRANTKGTMVKKYVLDTVDYTEAQYLSLIQDIEDRDAPRNAFKDFYKNGYKYIVDTLSSKSKEYSGVSITKITGESYGNDSYSTDLFVECSKYVINSSDPCRTEEHYDFLNYATVVTNSNYYKYLFSAKKGVNIGISFTENNLPSSSFGIDYKLVANCNTSYPDQIVHGAKVARTIKSIVPKATLYGLTTSCTSSQIPVALPIDGYDKVPKIYIGNHSYGNGVGVYDNQRSSFIDDFVYHTRTIEIASAGNEGLFLNNQITPYARGVNVVSVGAVHNDFTYDRSSSWKNPRFDSNDSYPNSGLEYVKPEIASFADLFFPKADIFKVDKVVKGTSAKLDPFFRQTSSATPFITALVAHLLDKFPFYRWHPEVVKALLITSSIIPIKDAAQHDKDNEKFKVAMGVPDGRAMAQYNRSRFWNGNKGDFFNSNGEIRFDEIDIDPTKTYRIAIAWLSSGSYVLENGRLPQDINLEVWQDGKTLGKSASESNPFEFVEIKPKSNKKLTIIIKRKRNDYGRVLLGYNLLEVH